MQAGLQYGFRLGEYEVRPLEGRLVGPSGAEHIQPKVMEVLVCLAERPAAVVERHDLLQAVWGTTSNSDDALTRCISELRHHLDDHPDTPRYIQTIPKRGYRLVADVQTLQESGEFERPPGPKDGERPRTFFEDLKRRKVVRVAIAYAVTAWIVIQVAETTLPALNMPSWTVTLVVVLAILGFAIAIGLSWAFQVTPEGLVFDRSADASPKKWRYVATGAGVILIAAAAVLISDNMLREQDVRPEIDGSLADAQTMTDSSLASLAVIRFQHIGDDPATQYFSDGLGENLLDFLSNLTEFRTAARTSSWSLSNRGLDVPTIANQLQVKNVLEGSVQRSSNHVRVWAQLVNDEGFHVWSQTYDRELTVENIFEIQDEIAKSVVDNLKVVLTEASEQNFGRRPTANLEALDFFLQGRNYLRGVHSPTRLKSAVQLFEKAIALDGEFASARANLCITHLYFYEIDASPTHFEAAEKSCNRALTHESNLDDVYTALGSLYRKSGQLEEADLYLRKALDLNPRSGEALYTLARTREDLGDLAGARALHRRSIELQPGYWFAHNSMGTFLRRVGETADAVDYFKRVIELVPDRAIGYVNLAATVSHLGDFQRALELYEQSLEFEPTQIARGNIGIVYYRLGRFEDSALAQEQTIRMAPDDHYYRGQMADALRQAGRSAEAEAAYLQAIDLIDRASDMNAKDPALIVARAKYLASIDRKEGVSDEVERALALAPKSASIHSLAARTYMLLGETDRTLELVETAIDLGESRHYIAADPDLAPLRGDAVFAALLRE